MNILITGGAGFIGSYLAKYHLSLNDRVVVVDNLSTGKLTNIIELKSNPNFSFYDTDVLEWEELDSVLSQCDLIYNMAAMVGMFNVIEQPIATLHANINIPERLLSSIATSARKPLIVIASSSEVYGSKETAMVENEPLLLAASTKAHASYMISKLCNEITAMAYYKEKQLPVIVVRLFNTIGPNQSSRYGMVLPRFVKQALSNEPLTIFSDGLQTRSFCDVRDVCRMLHQLTQTEKSWGQIINVGNDQEISILELAKRVISLAKSKSELTFQSYANAYGNEYIDIEHRKPDLGKLKNLINYSPQYKLDSTINDIIHSLS